MALYINNTGKLLGAAILASAATQAATGEDTGLARGCLIGLVVWLAWVSLILGAIFFLIFG
jgi:hypothetical protein